MPRCFDGLGRGLSWPARPRLWFKFETRRWQTRTRDSDPGPGYHDSGRLARNARLYVRAAGPGAAELGPGQWLRRRPGGGSPGRDGTAPRLSQAATRAASESVAAAVLLRNPAAWPSGFDDSIHLKNLNSLCTVTSQAWFPGRPSAAAAAATAAYFKFEV